MVEKGRNDLASKSDTLYHISEIIAFFSKDYSNIEGYKVEIYSAIVDALNRLDVDKEWTWKYLSNVESGHIKPGKRFAAAIDVLYRIIEQKPVYASVPICAKCGEVHEVPWCIYEVQMEMVKAVDGSVVQGSQSLGSLICSCGQPFISNHPRRRKCFICSKYRGKRRT
jgi:hypothetical protein